MSLRNTITVIIWCTFTALSSIAFADRELQKIAVVAFGSLYWAKQTPSSRGTLLIASDWLPNGPAFPVEFARISKGQNDTRRVTLVVEPKSHTLKTYYALSAFSSLSEAVENLKQREGTSKIHFLTRDGVASPGIPSRVQEEASSWLQHHENFDALIWTCLESNWETKLQRAWSVEEVLTLMETMNDLELHSNLEYFQRAPRSVQTPASKAIERRYGIFCSWIP